MNPIDVAIELRNRYVSYLTTTFGLNDGVRHLRDRFLKLLSQPGQLLAGPFLEATAPYVPGDMTLERLVESALLHSGFQRLFHVGEIQPQAVKEQLPRRGFGVRKGSGESTRPPSQRRERFPADRLLYRHQELAIKRLCRDVEQHDLDRNTVVASGTGSGKTECFLIPAIDWILRHPTRSPDGREEAIGRGLRVLLVYPMNALVNDQIRRLTQLVGSWRGRGDQPIPITFARYTSETQKSREEGLKHEPNAPDNQLLGRDEIIACPPDILITNFAMLEQALLRPQESPFFDAVDEFAWRFLILDEAHSYRGAQGIELSRLMQRVRAAVRRGKRSAGVSISDPICIATSATLAGRNLTTAERIAKTAEFASDLFGGTPFDGRSVIFADRLDPAVDADIWNFESSDREAAADQAWEALPTDLIRNLDLAADDSFWNALLPLAERSRWLRAKDLAGTDRRTFLYHLLHGHPRFHWLWERVRDTPQRFETLAEHWSTAGNADCTTRLGNLVSACNAARRCPGEQPLLPCRYHLFASALEGLFVTLASDQEKDEQKPDWDIPDLGVQQVAVRRMKPKDRVAFEISRCLNCQYPFLSTDLSPQHEGLDQPPVWTRPVQFLAFQSESADGPPLEAVRVDLRDGRVEGATSPGSPLWRTLFKVRGSADYTDIQTCPHCGYEHRHNQVVGRFQTGQDAPVSILTEALYEQLPGLDDRQQEQLRADFPHRFGPHDDPVVGRGRKLLVFSDSRQNAAFMASYLQDHAREYLIREIAYDALPGDGSAFDLNDWANSCIQQIQQRDLQIPFLQDRDLAEIRDSAFHESYFRSVSDKKNCILYYLLSELVGTQPLVLESLGLLQVEMPAVVRAFFESRANDALELDSGWPGAPLTMRDAAELADRVIRMMRRRYLLTIPQDVARPGFATLQHYLVKERQPGSADILHGLYNAGSQDTVYVDLLKRWGRKRSGAQPSPEQCRELLTTLFEGFKSEFEFQHLLESSTQSGLPALVLRHSGLFVRRAHTLWRCDACGAFSGTRLDGVCAEPYCLGTLHRVPADVLPASSPDLHVFTKRFVRGRRIELRCEEHTAQLSSEFGQQTQEAFQCGQINVLSCSTTFEMGIDIGALQAVVLRNVPPSTINYVQRAGRAGRRSDSVAFVLTFCQRRPHDRLYFNCPENIIAGAIEPPRIDRSNRKILQRHCFAEVLTEYWRWLDRQPVGSQAGRFQMAGNVGSFFEDRLDGTNCTAADYLRTWLAQEHHRGRCKERLTEAFPDLKPDEVSSYLDLVADPNPHSSNPLAIATDDAVSLLKSFRGGEERHSESARLSEEQAFAARGSGDHQKEEEFKKQGYAERDLAKSFGRLLHQQRRDFLISFLMSRGVLPSFAFPVNVVKLHVLREEFGSNRPEQSSNRLKFERDGKIGLGEYAPGAEVVAGKRVYQSVGLRKFPALEFDGTNWFRWCHNCNALQIWPQGTERPEDVNPECPTCRQQLRAGSDRPMQWVAPRWGFVTDATEKGKEPRGQRPSRIQTTRAFFLPQWPGDSAQTTELADVNTSESFPNDSSPVRVDGRYATGRSLLVLNLGQFNTDRHGILRRSGFRLCGRCGRVHFDDKDTPRQHRPPYHLKGRSCPGPIGLGANTDGQPIALGHRYETDVLWLDFHGTGRTLIDTGFWLSLAYALTNAACQELNIERSDLEATTSPLDNADRQAIVIYDAVPGGAGHCQRILARVPDVIRRAQAILSACDCDPNSVGCYGCLCDYQNQFAHDQLSRGPALGYLDEVLDVLDAGESSPWRTPSAAPCREMADSLHSATDEITLITREIRPGVIKGLNRDWFDLLKEVAGRPCGAGNLRIIVGVVPRPGQSAEETVAYHRIAELQSLGVQLSTIRSSVPAMSSLTIGSRNAPGAIAWQWPWRTPLGPDTDGARRSRIGRAEQACSSLEIPTEVASVSLPQLREFHEFTLEPGVRHNMFAPALLGNLLRHAILRLLLVDPHGLHGPKQVEIIRQFLRAVRPDDKCQFRVRAGRVRGDQRRGDFTGWSEQDAATQALLRQFSHPQVKIDFPADGYFVDHDRLIYFHFHAEGRDQFYKVILGQGLFGFDPGCRRRSHVVWFEIPSTEFESEWDRND